MKVFAQMILTCRHCGHETRFEAQISKPRPIVADCAHAAELQLLSLVSVEFRDVSMQSDVECVQVFRRKDAAR